MAEIPSMWRTELLHPLSVHFPIVLLLFGTVLFLVSIFVKAEDTSAFLLSASRLLLWPGVILAWIAVYTGDQAGSEVTRSLCDPTVLKTHEINAYRMAYIFSAAILLNLVPQFVKIRVRLKKAILMITCLLLMIGSGYLVYVGHLGASLVYQQGAGVYQPTEDCQEFE